MAKNYESIYTHSSEPNKVHRFTQKYSNIQNFLIILKKLPYTDFDIGDVVAGTTLMTTLGKTLS